MKYLVLVAILAVVVLVFFGRGRNKIEPPKPPQPAKPPLVKTEILACAHCGVHLPKSEASFDAAGRPFCTPEHRVAGPQ
jgi:uncharacterized protein